MRSEIDLLQILRENEEIRYKFNKVETKILSILNYKDLFEILLSEIQDQFGVPFVWLSIIEETEIYELIRSINNSEILRDRLNFIERKFFADIFKEQSAPILANSHLKSFYKLFPHKKTYLIKSIAITPIFMDNEFVGSLNQADSSAERFTPEKDASLLAQLGVKISLCLSNVTAHEKLRYLAYHDPLTGLLNRRVMEKALNREMTRADRYQSPLTLVFIDVDSFKQINDNYGHDVGDEVLKYIAKKLQAETRQSDIIARYAGDEFVMIFPETPLKNAEQHMQRILKYFKDHPLIWKKHRIYTSISYGTCSTEKENIKTADEILKSADEQLYEVKKKGRLNLPH